MNEGVEVEDVRNRKNHNAVPRLVQSTKRMKSVGLRGSLQWSLLCLINNFINAESDGYHGTEKWISTRHMYFFLPILTLNCSLLSSEKPHLYP